MLIALRIPDVTADRRARLGRHDNVEPFRVRRSVLGAQDFHLVAVLQHGVQRPDLAVDARTDTGVADVRVNRIGKVHHSRVIGERDQVTIGRETEDLVLKQVELGVVEKLLRILAVLQDVHQLLHPVVVIANRLLSRDRAALVSPVRRHAQLGAVVHVHGPDLDLDRLTFGADDDGVDGLIAVGLRRGDVVLVAPHPMGIGRVQRAQRGVTIANVFNDDTEGHDIGQLAQIEVLGLHLLPDRVRRFDPAVDLDVFQARIRHILTQLPDDIDGQRITLFPQKLRALHDGITRFGHEVEEGKVFELFLQVHHPDPGRQRRVDFQRLGRNPRALLGLGDEVQRPHVVEAVGKLDQQHANVATQREQQLAEVLRLLQLVAGGLQVRKLSDALNQLTHRRAKELADVLVGRVRVFDHVVQKRSRNGRRIKAFLGQIGGHANRMDEVRIARRAHLRRVHGLGVVVGRRNDRRVEFRVRFLHPVNQLRTCCRPKALGGSASLGKGIRHRTRPTRCLVFLDDNVLEAHAAIENRRRRRTRTKGGEVLQHGVGRLLLLTTLRREVWQLGQFFDLNVTLERTNIGFADVVLVHTTARQFPQGNHGVLVVVTGHFRGSAARKLTGTLSSEDYELKAVWDFFDAVFNGDTRHRISQSMIIGM